MREAGAFQGLAAIAVIGAVAVYLSTARESSAALVVSCEAVGTGLVIGLGFPDSAVLLPYMVVLPLVSALYEGLTGLAAVIVAQAVALAVVPPLVNGPENLQLHIELLAPWLATGIGVGLLGVWLKRSEMVGAPIQPDPSYESARRLLTQLRTVARRLSAGLDAASMSTQLLSVVHEATGDAKSALFVRTDGGVLAPAAYLGDGAQAVLLPNDPLIEQCWSEMEPTQSITTSGVANHRYRVALPLRVGSRMIGVLLSSSRTSTPGAVLTSLMRQVDEHSMRIETALVFEEVRTLATADERRRLAREIHDGIAQEVASLGYSVDALTAAAKDPEFKERAQELRAELTRLVSELRHSIFDLRSETTPNSGLGAALSDYVRQVGARSNMTVHLTLDEAPTRLTAGVEAELLRIAQEAVTNARKHSQAANLWVDCRVHPPCARLEIRDDGRGIGERREDSYGIQIMRERARRIDAILSISTNTPNGVASGTLVTVALGDEGSPEGER